MNCKQGDLAIIVKSSNGHQGKIVRCLERYNGPWAGLVHTPGWKIDVGLRYANNPCLWPYLADYALRPIRPQSDDAHDPADVLVPRELV